MNLPEDFETATHEVIARSETLIETGIWDGIDKNRLRNWLEVFQGKEEKYLAALLLNALIYRSEKQTTALATQLFQRRLPKLLEPYNVSFGPEGSLLRILQDSSIDPHVRIVPIINTMDPPTKSGPLVCRLLRRTLQLCDKWMIWPEQIGHCEHRHVQAFIFVDDFLGSGLQTIRFFSTFPQRTATDPPFVYSPFLAYGRGIDALKKRVPWLQVTAAETVDDRHRLFDPDAASNGNAQSPLHAKQLYDAFLLRSGLTGKLGKFQYGYEKLSMAISFQHGTPNASLPLFWLRRENLNPLFDR